MALPIVAYILTAITAILPSRILSKVFKKKKGNDVKSKSPNAKSNDADEEEEERPNWGKVNGGYVKFMLRGKNILRLLKLCQGNYPMVIASHVISVTSTFTYVFTPLQFSRCLDVLGEENAKEKLYDRAREFIILTSFTAVLNIFSQYVTSRVRKSVDKTVRTKLYTAILSQDLNFFENKNTQSSLANDVYTSFHYVVKYSTLGPYVGYIQSMIRLVLAVGILWRSSPKLSIYILVISPIVNWVSRKLYQYVNDISQEIYKNKGDHPDVIHESLSNIRLIKAFSTEDRCIKQFEDNFDKNSSLELKMTVIQSIASGFSMLAGKFSEIIVIIVGGGMVLNGDLTVGEITMFLTYAQQVSSYMSTFNYFLSDLTQSGFFISKVFGFLDYVPTVNAKGGLKPEKCEGMIEFKNVNFRYPSRKQAHVIKDLSFKISPGEVVAFAGPSGSGKSTIITLLNRFYDPNDGSISIDGNDLRSLDLPWFHKHVGFVSQEPVLMPGTIEENIAYGVEEYTQEQMETVCELANVKEFVADTSMFPKGLKTQVGDKGVKLSGGQKQRVAIARALMKNPKIVIFDEATSALDAESEHQVQKAINRLMGEGKRTMIIIAHRLSTIINCHRIFAMKGGEIKEVGSHQELMSLGGIYKELFERQLAGLEGQIPSTSDNSPEMEKESAQLSPHQN